MSRDFHARCWIPGHNRKVRRDGIQSVYRLTQCCCIAFGLFSCHSCIKSRLSLIDFNETYAHGSTIQRALTMCRKSQTHTKHATYINICMYNPLNWRCVVQNPTGNTTYVDIRRRARTKHTLHMREMYARASRASSLSSPNCTCEIYI